MPGSLFDRLTRGGEGARMSDDESIRLHLLRLLTARQGSVQALPDYGLPDLNDLTLARAELVTETCRAVKACIRRYEPRLTEVEVSHQPLPESLFAMGFRIRALKLGEDGGMSPWQWDITLNGDNVRGRV